jgi:molecular chaperone GrpE
LRDFFKKKAKQGSEVDRNMDRNDVNDASELSPEERAMAADSAATDAETARLAADLEDLRQTLLRRQADFENDKKRMEKERGEDTKRTTARLAESIIPIVDGFEQALAAHREKEYENYRRGFELIYKQLIDNLAKLGVERVDPTGMTFDPHLHQAMDRMETTEHEDGTIVQMFQPAYVYHGRVLRPAMVRVAVNPAGASKKTAN